MSISGPSKSTAIPAWLPTAESAPAMPASFGALSDWVELCKLRITLMVVITTYLGFAMGARAGAADAMAGAAGLADWLVLTAALVGAGLSCMGASVLNQVLERDTDALMHRTRDRPIPAGRVGVGAGMVGGLLLAIAGVGLLAAGANWLAASLSALTVLSYVLVYTPLKRVTTLSTIIGAVPGALPPVIGYAAATGTVGPAAWAMFAIMGVWQLPHFLAIAWLYREDYARAKMVMLPVLDPDGASTFRQILLGCMALLPLGLWPTLLGVSGLVYFASALIAGLVFLGFGVALVLRPTAGAARALFLASLVYLPAVLAMMLIDS